MFCYMELYTMAEKKKKVLFVAMVDSCIGLLHALYLRLFYDYNYMMECVK